ncbi:MAG: serine/threonine protein kinase-like [Planctomycetota bacterium]|nr:MAG: serine/threonine protein kinase-like [Planctomycetota bacterium]
MKRVLTLAVIGLVAGGCGGDAPTNAPPANSDARRAELHRSIVENTPFKKVMAECVLDGVRVTHVSLREDSLFIEGFETTDAHGRMDLPVLFRVNARNGEVGGVTWIPKELDFRPSAVPVVVKQLNQLEADRAKLIAERQVETTRKDKDVAKVTALSDKIRQVTDLIENTKLQDRVYGVSANDKLHVVERPSMQEFERPNLRFTPSTGVAASPSVVFMGALDRNRLIGLDPKTWAEIMFFKAEGEIKTTPIYAEPSNVYFASEDGHVYGYTADGRKLIDYRTERAIVCDLCLDLETNAAGNETWGALFAASTDCALYCFNRKSGELMWKYETGSELRTAPQVSGEVVYCYSKGKGMHAIEKRTGKLLYIKPDAWYPLCRGKDRVFLAGPGTDTVIAVEEKTGKELGRSSIAHFAHVVSDPRTRTIYLVTRDGFIYAAKESEIDY